MTSDHKTVYHQVSWYNIGIIVKLNDGSQGKQLILFPIYVNVAEVQTRETLKVKDNKMNWFAKGPVVN